MIFVVIGVAASCMALVLAAVMLRRAVATEREAAEFYAAALRTRQEALDAEARARDLKAKREMPVWFAAKRRKELWVHLTDDSTVKGVVADVDEQGVLLEQAEYLGGDKAVGLGGRIWLPRERINFTQLPPAPNGARA